MPASHIFHSRSGRFFVVLMLSCFLTSSFYQIKHTKLTHPEKWYFITIDSKELDAHSISGRKMIEMHSTSEDWILASKHCELNESLFHKPIKAEYKNLTLCNTAAQKKNDFDISNQFFRSRVDDLYREFYKSLFSRTFSGILYGFTAWSLFLLLFLVIRWIMNGSKK